MPDPQPPQPGTEPVDLDETRELLSQGLRRARGLATAARRLFEFQTTPTHRPPPDVLKD